MFDLQQAINKGKDEISNLMVSKTSLTPRYNGPIFNYGNNLIWRSGKDGY